VDVILATGPPFVAFRLAKRVADRLGRPYVLDYRDPWTGSPHPEFAGPTNSREEVRILKSCAAITIVSPSWGRALDRRFGVGPKLHVLTNGYDPEELTPVTPHVFGHFAIVYAGIFYPPKRTITPVMAALKVLAEGGRNGGQPWYFHYYGPDDKHVGDEAARFGLMHRVVLHGRVPRAEALAAQRGAGAAVVITSVFDSASLEDDGIVTGKLFELLGLGAPIVLVAPSGSDARAIIETVSIAKGFTGSDAEGMASFLRNTMSRDRSERTSVSAYAWTNIGRRLDAILRSVMT
jgi:glycosyltransferase involved in cell wall biosynthesis